MAGEAAGEWRREEVNRLARRAQHHVHAQQRVGARGACVTRPGPHPPPSLPFLQHPVDGARDVSTSAGKRRSIDGDRSGKDGRWDDSDCANSAQQMERRWDLLRHMRAVGQGHTQSVGQATRAQRRRWLRLRAPVQRTTAGLEQVVHLVSVDLHVLRLNLHHHACRAPEEKIESGAFRRAVHSQAAGFGSQRSSGDGATRPVCVRPARRAESAT
jgi:hypothetical protein